MNNHWEFNDGGREAAGYKGKTSDCVVRAIAIAMRMPYQTAYDDLYEAARDYAATRRTKQARALQRSPEQASPRTGVFPDVLKPYIAECGWEWVRTMAIGTGCRVHLRADELPGGRIIASVSRHLVAVIDGVIQDTSDPSRRGTRCVYGYWHKPQ